MKDVIPGIPSIPAPPYDTVMPEQAATVQLIIWIFLAAAALAYCGWISLRRRSWLPILIEVGAGCAMIGEALIIHNMHCWYPVVGQQSLWKSVGASIPLLVPFAYLFYFGPVILLMMDAFEKGVSKRVFWLFYLGCMFGVTVYEIVGIAYGLHIYYGDFPFYLFGKFPLVLPFLHATLLVVPATVFYKVKNELRGWRLWLVMPFMAGQVCGLEMWLGMPFYVAISSPVPPLWATLAGLMSIAFALGVVQFCAELVAKRRK